MNRNPSRLVAGCLLFLTTSVLTSQTHPFLSFLSSASNKNSYRWSIPKEAKNFPVHPKNFGYILEVPGGIPSIKLLKQELDPKPSSYDIPVLTLKPDQVIGITDGFRPEVRSQTISRPLVSVKEIGVKNGKHLVQVSIFPFTEKENKLVLLRSIDFEIHFAAPLGRSVPVKPVFEFAKTSEVQYDVTSDLYKLKVDQDGMYRVTGAELANAGVNLSAIDPRTLKLYLRGAQVAIYVNGDADGHFDPGDYFEFWGDQNKKTFLTNAPDLYQDPFTKENMYWLGWGGSFGLRLVEESGIPSETNPNNFIQPISYRYRIHEERDYYFDRLSRTDLNELSTTRDHWFYDRWITENVSKSYPLHLSYPDLGSTNGAIVETMLSGLSIGPEVSGVITPSSHDAEVSFGNATELTTVGQSTWHEQDYAFISNLISPLPANKLKQGENIIQIRNRRITFDQILPNWFEVEYSRLYKTDQDWIQFQVPPTKPFGFSNINLYQFSITGFTSPDIEIYKLGISKISSGRVEYDPSESSYRITFQNEILDPNVQFVALTGNKKKQVKSIDKYLPVQLVTPGQNADYLVISHANFLQTLEGFKTYRETQANPPMSVKIIDVQSIYDELNYGIKNPYVIRDFLRYAYRNWTSQFSRPKYVLLVGDGTLHYKENPAGGNRDFLSPVLIQTIKWGASAADLWYVLLEGDDLIPEMNIGRLPVNDNQQLQNIIDKIKEYENPALNIDPWQTSVTLIGGEIPLFKDQQEDLVANRLPREFTPNRIYSAPAGNQFFGGNDRVVESFNSGQLLVNFMGHGGGAIWADNGLLRNEDIDRFINRGKYPLVTSMTCFTSSFEETLRVPIGEKFITEKNKGAIGVWASSGVGWAWNDFFAIQELYKFIFTSNSIGDAITDAKISYIANYDNYALDYLYIGGSVFNYPELMWSILFQYNYFGDPAVKLKRPAPVSALVAKEVLAVGDTIKMSTSPLPFSNGTVTIQPFDAISDTVGSPQNRALAGNSISFDYKITPAFDSPRGGIRFYAKNSNSTQSANGAVEFVITGAKVDSIQTSPLAPTNENPIFIEAVVESLSPISTVECQIYSGPIQPTTLSMTLIGPKRYRTTTAIPGSPFPPGTRINYFIRVTDTNNFQSQSERKQISVLDAFADVSLTSKSNVSQIGLTGTTRVELAARIFNLKSSPVESLLVKFIGLDNSSTVLWSDSLLVKKLSANADSTVKIVFPTNLTAISKISVNLDPNRHLKEQIRLNNDKVNLPLIQNYVNVVPAWGTVTNIAGPNYTIRLPDSSTRVSLPAGSVSQNSVLFVSETQTIKSGQKQPDLHDVKLKVSGNIMQFEITNSKADTLINGTSLFLQTRVDTTQDPKSKIYFYWFDPKLALWKQAPRSPVFSGDTLKLFNFNRLGRYKVFANYDSVSPNINLNVEGQFFTSGSYVPENPKISAVITDLNGIDLSKYRIRFIKDLNTNPQLVPFTEISFPDTLSNPTSASISTTTNFPAGKHTITLQAYDVNGNMKTDTKDLIVAANSDMTVYGNFPNPLVDASGTIFAFNIATSQVAENVKIKIFTVSGRLIKVFDSQYDKDFQAGNTDLTTNGFHEVFWDGTDKDGNQVANGVYFAQFKAKFKDGNKEKILKVAVLR